MDIKQPSPQGGQTLAGDLKKQSQEIISSAAISQFLVRTMAKDLEALAKKTDQQQVSLYVKPSTASKEPSSLLPPDAQIPKPAAPPQPKPPAGPPLDLPIAKVPEESVKKAAPREEPPKPSLSTPPKTTPEKIIPPKPILLTEKIVEPKTSKINFRKILLVGVPIVALLAIGIGGWFLWGIFSTPPEPSPTPSPTSTPTPSATPTPLALPSPPFAMEKTEVIGLNIDQQIKINEALLDLTQSASSGTLTQIAFKDTPQDTDEQERLLTLSEFVSYFNLATFNTAIPTSENATSSAVKLLEFLDQEQYFPFIYYQVQNGATPFSGGQSHGRIGLIATLKNGVKETEIKKILESLEPSMPYDLRDILYFVSSSVEIPKAPEFLDNIYKDYHIRYVNFPFSTLTLDYAIVDNYLVLTTSKEAMYAAIDRMMAAKETGTKGNTNIDMSDWQTYRNEEYGFEISFPESWEGHKITVKKNSILKNYDLEEYKEIASLCFEYPIKISNKGQTGDVGFVIGIYDENNWQLVQGMKELGKKNNYVYGSMPSSGAAPDDLLDRHNEIGQILSTFKFTQ